MAISILINGAHGKMGQLACDIFDNDTAFKVVAKCSRQDNLANVLENLKPDVAIDLTVADAAYENTKTIIEAGVRPVIGTSGLTEKDIEHFKQMASKKKLGGIVVPNFSIGAVLMMQFSQTAAPYFDHVEIVEKHHEQKKDKPSGTARRTAELIQKHHQAPIHSIRSPGFLASQDVIFGTQGETLTLSHNTISREAFREGMRLSCERVMDLNTLECGLETFL